MLKTFTTSQTLLHVLKQLCLLPVLSEFRLVGGTALSLQRGHRISEDIDLFTSQLYGSVSFNSIEQELKSLFPVVENTDIIAPGQPGDNHYGLHLFIGTSEDDLIKTDLLHWSDDFLFPVLETESIRLATIEEIALMKLDVISRGGRKKDFWDMSEILETHNLAELLSLYQQKYLYAEVADVITGLINFSVADEMPDPECLKGKHWELIKEEMSVEQARLTSL